VVFVWTAVFTRLRRRRMDGSGVISAAIIAMLFAVLIPETVTPWQQALALSFGVVFGGLVFGGRGRGFLNPVVVALSFLAISGIELTVMDPSAGALNAAEPGALVPLAGLIAGAVLLATGLISWRLIAGAWIVLLPSALLWPVPEGAPTGISAALIIGLVFLIADPAASGCTQGGRWAHGLMAGALIILFNGASPAAIGLSAVVSAAFLTSVFAPTFDHLAITLNARRRAGRDGYGDRVGHARRDRT